MSSSESRSSFSSAFDPEGARKTLGSLTLSVAMALWAASPASATPQVGNQWIGPWEYSCQIGDPSFGSGKELSHAALIPRGPYRGKVLLWRSPHHDSTEPPQTETWIFDPAQTDLLIKVPQNLLSNIFCAGMSWEKDGKLVVAGGIGDAGTPGAKVPPKRTYLFEPGDLDLPGGFVAGSPPCMPHVQNAVPGGPFREVGQMSVGRYYPTLTALCEGTISGTPPEPDIPGGASLVAAGAVLQDLVGGGQAVHYGNDYWQLMPPASGTWSRTFQSPNPTLPGQVPGPFENYDLMPTTAPPNPRMESYPRMFQLSDINDFTRNILAANDVAPDGGIASLTPAGDSWVARLRYGGAPLTQLWRGPSALQGASIDRDYGTAVFFHMPSSSTPTHNGLNRVLVFGGQQDEPGGKRLNPTVQEYNPRSNPAFQGFPTDAEWIIKDPTVPSLVPRKWLNAVILPTGKVLILGGFRECPSDQAVLIPEHSTQLYDPGPAGEVAGASVTNLAPSNPAGAGLQPYARGYHSVAGLLQDGRVFQAGGLGFVAANWTCGPPPAYANGMYSAEIYSPPYMGYPDRPRILRSADQVGHGQVFEVTTDRIDGFPIERFVLLRPAAVTHHFDSDQRYVELTFVPTPPSIPPVHVAVGTERYDVTAPAVDLAPPGYYLLFAVRPAQSNPSELLPSIGWYLKID